MSTNRHQRINAVNMSTGTLAATPIAHAGSGGASTGIMANTNGYIMGYDDFNGIAGIAA